MKVGDHKEDDLSRWNVEPLWRNMEHCGGWEVCSKPDRIKHNHNPETGQRFDNLPHILDYFYHEVQRQPVWDFKSLLSEKSIELVFSFFKNYFGQFTVCHTWWVGTCLLTHSAQNNRPQCRQWWRRLVTEKEAWDVGKNDFQSLLLFSPCKSCSRQHPLHAATAPVSIFLDPWTWPSYFLCLFRNILTHMAMQHK